jgi:hypothetical protein
MPCFPRKAALVGYLPYGITRAIDKKLQWSEDFYVAITVFFACANSFISNIRFTSNFHTGFPGEEFKGRSSVSTQVST